MLISEALREVELYGGVVDKKSGEITPRRESDFIRPPRPARCGWSLSQGVGVHTDGNVGHYSGTERCASVHACPVCSAVIRAERQKQIRALVDAHRSAGGEVVFVTLTLSHKREDPLSRALDSAMTSWSKLLEGRAWLRFRETFGVVGYVRSLEVTYGANGWHPHIHGLFFVDRRLSDLEMSQWSTLMYGRWETRVIASGGRAPIFRHGIDVQRVDGDGRVIVEYMTKAQEKQQSAWDVDSEMARADLKKGHGTESRVPFEFLDSSSTRDAELWREYVHTTSGRRAFTFSRGLRERYEIEDRDDEEIIEDTHGMELAYIAEAESYDRLRRKDPGLLADVLRWAAEGQWGLVEAILPGERRYSEGSGRSPEHLRSTGETMRKRPFCRRL